MLLPSTARAKTGLFAGNPVLTAFQLVPLLVERKMPFVVPAKRLLPLTARDLIAVSARPELTAFQLVPLLTSVQEWLKKHRNNIIRQW
jgi:hypothetical protein